MKHAIKSCVLYCLIGLLVSCDDLIEPDISTEKIALRTPAESLSTTSTRVNFWWDELDGARKYRIQIATPDFENPVSLEVDSVVSVNKITLELPVGDYQWCVNGENFAYTTDPTCRTLHITD